MRLQITKSLRKFRKEFIQFVSYFCFKKIQEKISIKYLFVYFNFSQYKKISSHFHFEDISLMYLKLASF